MKNKKKKLSKVTVLYNEVTKLPVTDDKAMLAEAGAIEEANLLAKTLQKCGFFTDIFEINRDTIKLLPEHRTDLYLNVSDGIGDDIKSESQVPEFLDSRGIAYTGSDAKGLVLTTDKVKTKEIFTKLGLRTPKSKVFEEIPQVELDLDYPMIIKPALEDSSVGININSVVKNFPELQIAIKKLLSNLNEKVLVEEYIDGRELNIAILGNGLETRALPISEIIFGDYYLDRPKVIDFEAKWVEASQEFKQTSGVCPADLPIDLAQEISNQSIAIFHACGGRDYCRVDVRLDNNNKPYFLEINLNPDIRPDTGLFRSAKAAGYDYTGFLFELIRTAATRYGKIGS